MVVGNSVGFLDQSAVQQQMTPELRALGLQGPGRNGGRL